LLIRLLALLALIAATPAPASASPQNRAPLVLAAASLQEGLTTAADRWAAKGHARPVLSFAASSALARQIAQGAPADLFLCADEEWMDYAAKASMIQPKTRARFLTNRLALIAPANSPLRLTIAPNFPLAAALGPNGRLAMGEPSSVPAGKYAAQALRSLKIWPQIAPRIAGAESVRAALALVARGEAPLGITYATDAKVEPRVRTIALFPDGLHTPITYPIALLTRSTAPEAEGFRRFLLSGEGRAIFAAYGFGAP
jgi:molybdate transport system substrate-binding protein